MLEIVRDLIGKIFSLDFAAIAVFVVALNIFLTGLRKALELIKDKTKTDLDNKLYKFLGDVLEWLLRIIDVIGSNPAHKPEDKK